MGMKTTNYKVASMNNFNLETAYAYIVECKSDRNSGYADIGIFADRVSAESGAEPFETKRIYFTVDRNENDRQTAYLESKKIKEIQKYNPETKETETVKVNSPFTGWEDDMQV